MKRQVLMYSFVLLYTLIFLTQATQGQDEIATSQSTTDINFTNQGPVVKAWEPKSGSVNSIIELQGYRLCPQLEKTKAVIIQNGIEIPAGIRGGSSITNDQHNGEQTLRVIVPEGVVPGESHIVVQVNDHRTIPVAFTITEWKPPVIKRVTPETAAPGTFIWIECDGFHTNDEIEITDANGHQFRFDPGGSSHCTGFGIPKDAPEGVLSVRIGNRTYGNGLYTESFAVTVTNNPLPLELKTTYMKPVAPGQWLDLQNANMGPLKHSELTEVTFTQTGRTIVVAAPKPFRPRVAVPGALTPGEVQLQTRTWRNGRPSEWSEPVTFELIDRPLAPSVAALRLEQGGWVQLWRGPDRASSFRVTAGDEVVLNGLWPVADASKLKVLLVRPGEIIELSASELDEKADWFSDVRVRLPESLEDGDWTMVVRSEADGTHHEVPIVIRVCK